MFLDDLTVCLAIYIDFKGLNRSTSMLKSVKVELNSEVDYKCLEFRVRSLLVYTRATQMPILV